MKGKQKLGMGCRNHPKRIRTKSENTETLFVPPAMPRHAACRILVYLGLRTAPSTPIPNTVHPSTTLMLHCV
ncbi:hypothetical protein NQ317_007702 [Molorchus minor]|uniref:Uncharacterized protein n=1 Tax=Molorchus minor TaxID=1323400 RepID=A0ABQ9JR00_9CUCU|nr:hypothetical protein NQ317_007702 [Molorchus minor]